MCKYYVGIDTSNYTTSIGVIDEENNIILDLRKPLVVKENNRGLRQQEAVFQHLNNFPILIDEMARSIDLNKIDTIAVSTRPRSLDDSYMPVFILGKNQAFILSKVLNKNYKEFSHQEGHVGAGILDNYMDPNEEFLSFHISGGTSEIIYVESNKDNLNIKLLGGSLDISMGQLIDRIGVYLGYKFPCGKELDLVSRNGKIIDLNIPISIKNELWSNLSGLENYFIKLIDSNKYSREDIIITLFHVLSIILEKLIKKALERYKLKKILITGGVSSNSYIRDYLLNSKAMEDVSCIFPKPQLCTDNGIGIAYLGKFKKGH